MGPSYFLIASLPPNIDILQVALFLFKYILIMGGLLMSLTVSEVVREGGIVN